MGCFASSLYEDVKMQASAPNPVIQIDSPSKPSLKTSNESLTALSVQEFRKFQIYSIMSLTKDTKVRFLNGLAYLYKV